MGEGWYLIVKVMWGHAPYSLPVVVKLGSSGWVMQGRAWVQI
jgi:hypothetical protein